jgi:Cu2+-exporting ATPase
MKKQLNITGMSCGHCVSHVKSALEDIDAVSLAEVSLENHQADVTASSEVPDEALVAAVVGAGYEAEVRHS